MAEKMNVHTEFTGSSAGFDKTIRDVNSGMGNMAKNAKNYAASFVSLGVAIGATKKVIDLYIQGLKQSGEGADKLERFTTQLKAGFDSLAISIEKASFANLVANWERATKAAGEYADEMDLVNDRMQDLSVKRASVASSVQMLRAKKADGTITKEEAEQLKKETEDLLKIELDIYDEAIKAQVKFIADKRGLNADLFKTLETGIDQRVNMNQDELKGLDQYVKDYKAFNKQLIDENTSIVKGASTNPFDPGIKSVTNWDKINEELSTYLSHIPEAARLQIFQQLFAGEEDWNKLIGFLVERNKLTGEYAGLLRTATNAGKAGSFKADRPSVDGISSISTNNFSFGKGKIGLLPSQASSTEQINAWADSQIRAIEDVQRSAEELQGTFEGMFLSIIDGSQSFGDAFISVIQRITAEILSKAAVFALLKMNGSSSVDGVSLLNFIGGIGGKDAGLPYTPGENIQGYATGTNFAPGGMSVVGERGPELLNLPRGSQVIPMNNQSMRVEVIGQIKGSDIQLALSRYSLQRISNT